MQSSLVPLEVLSVEPYRSIVCYPRFSSRRMKGRIRELGSLGVSAIDFSGDVKLGRVSILGKGTNGLVVRAHTSRGEVALKMRRVDASRTSSIKEARILGLANEDGVGPRVIGASKNFLMMELALGEGVLEWVKRLKGRGSTKTLRDMLMELLYQCFRLDAAGIDHGELSNLRKHVIIGQRLWIIDFESASTKRRVSNVTSAAQYLLIGGPLSIRIRRMLGVKDSNRIINSLRMYKVAKNQENFNEFLLRAKIMRR